MNTNKAWFKYTEGVFSNQDTEKYPETFTVDVCQVSTLPDSFYESLELDKGSEEYENFLERCDYDVENVKFYKEEEDICGGYGTNQEGQDFQIFSKVRCCF
jgi:hypothetical protein